MKYIALLRGINVGGNNKIDMKALVKTFAKAGYKNVSTYINTGNIIFETSETDYKKIASNINKWISNDFHLDIPVLLKSADEFIAISNQVPEIYQNNKEQKTDVMFLWAETDSKKVLGEFSTNPLVDKVKYVPGALIWHIDKSSYNQSKLGDLIKLKLYKQMTIRNVNTVRKIAKLLTSD